MGLGLGLELLNAMAEESLYDISLRETQSCFNGKSLYSAELMIQGYMNCILWYMSIAYIVLLPETFKYILASPQSTHSSLIHTYTIAARMICLKTI